MAMDMLAKKSLESCPIHYKNSDEAGMKVIISHDADHLYLKEHLSDTFLRELLLRSVKSVSTGIKERSSCLSPRNGCAY